MQVPMSKMPKKRADGPLLDSEDFLRDILATIVAGEKTAKGYPKARLT